MRPPTTTVWTSSTARGNAELRVTDGNEPEPPPDDVHEIVHVTDTDPGHATGRPSAPVRRRNVCAHAPGAEACSSIDAPSGSYRDPDPAQAISPAPVSPGRKDKAGVADTVTHKPAAHSDCDTTPVQFVTSTNDGTPTIDAMPTGGLEPSIGCGNTPTRRPRAIDARFAGVAGTTQRKSNAAEPSVHSHDCHTTDTSAGGGARSKSNQIVGSSARSSGIVTQ